MLRVRELPASAALALVDEGKVPGYLPAGSRVFEAACPHTQRPHYRAVSLPSPEEIHKQITEAARLAGLPEPDPLPADAALRLPPVEQIKRSIVQSLDSCIGDACGCVGRWWAFHGPDYDLAGCVVHGGACAN